LQENLVIATSKHFPSHSTALGDSHFVLPVNDDDEQTVRDEYLPPFIAAIEAGTDMMMITHDIYKAWEETMPCTFSHRILTGLLREELGYEGLIITDDMNMGAIMATEWDEHPDLLAIAAGADIILDAAANGLPGFGIAPGNLEYAFDVKGQIDTIIEAVTVGRIPEEQINESVRRILRTKMKYCLFDDPYVNVSEVEEHVNTRAQIETSLDLHTKALTLVRNDRGLWPLDPAQEAHVHVVCPRAFLSEMYPDSAWQTIATSTLLKEVEGLASSVSGDQFDVDPSRRAIRKIVRKARRSGADILVIGTYNALFYDSQTSLVDQLLDLDIPTIQIALAMPYDVIAFPEASTCLATYSNRNLALEAAARALFGYADPLGRLPVSMPGLYDVEKAVKDAPLPDQ
ncbi:glycoside hydrolase family 3 protein, partial [Thermodesulfobacteriota bacterium]